MLRIQEFGFEDEVLYQLAFDIRKTVFVDEQKVDPDIECEFEEEARYYIIFLQEKAVGTARWRKTDEGIKLERFAILKEYRKQGLGSLLLDAILAEIIPLDLKIYLHAQKSAVDFYIATGFSIAGEVFYEADIPHYKMVME